MSGICGRWMMGIRYCSCRGNWMMGGKGVRKIYLRDLMIGVNCK